MLTQVVALLSGRVFIGRPMSREQEWIKATTDFTRDVEAIMQALLKWPSFIRGIVTPYLPEVRRMSRSKARTAELLAPILDICMKAARNQNEKDMVFVDEYKDQQGTFISWFLNQYGDQKERISAAYIAEQQMNCEFDHVSRPRIMYLQTQYHLQLFILQLW